MSRRSLKVSADKNRRMVLGGKDGLDSEIRLDETRLECVLEKSGKYIAECCSKLTNYDES